MRKWTMSSLLDVIGELFSDEISIAISTTEEYVYYRPSKRVDLKIQPGDTIQKGTIAYKAITSGQKASQFIDKNIFGVPYHGMAVPYFNEDEVEGCVLAIYPTFTEGRAVVTLKTDDGWKPIPFQDVQYIEAKNRKTYIYSTEFSGTHNSTLQDFEYLLPPDSFIRCHRSFIINVHHINEIYPDAHSTFVLAMKDGKTIPVSQNYSSYFRKVLGF